MEKLSRVKKYEDLRKQIEDNTIGADTLPEEKLQDYAQRLNEIDPSIFKKVTVTTEEDTYIPGRERKDNDSYTSSINDGTGEFRNEYLDDFINEVREYNIKKGNRENENTQIDILNQLNAVSRAKRSDYVENIADEPEVKDVDTTASMSKDEIAAQLKNFIWESETNEASEEPIILTSATETPKQVIDMTLPKQEETFKEVEILTQEVRKEQLQAAETKIQKDIDVLPTQTENLSTDTKSDPTKKHPFLDRKAKPSVVPTREEQAEVEREKLLQQKLVEETQQLRVQLNEYEDDLNDLSEGVEKTNKMLNIILGCLILALLVIIGIIVFWIVQAGGLV